MPAKLLNEGGIMPPQPHDGLNSYFGKLQKQPFFLHNPHISPVRTQMSPVLT